MPLTASPPTPTKTDLWSSSKSDYSSLEFILRCYLGPGVLLLLIPFFVNAAAYATLETGGSLWLTLDRLQSNPVTTLEAMFPLPTPRAMKACFGFMLFETTLFLVVPGNSHVGPRSPSGFVPEYRANGGACFLITFYVMAVLVRHDMMSASIVYEELLPIITLLNAFALSLCAVVGVKGVYHPSTGDYGYSKAEGGTWLFRLFWGEELYPRAFGVDLKHLVITRFGMMGWAVFTVSFVVASAEKHSSSSSSWSSTTTVGYPMMASAGLNFLYVAKFFFLYEVPYYVTGADMAVDRFGFMLCYGTVAFMPLVHNLQTLHLARNSEGLVNVIAGPVSLAAWYALGGLMIFLNYDSDTQRQKVRAARGDCLVWGAPARVLKATYRTADGATHESLLVMSGYSGIARHFHYVPDIVLLCLYTFPAGFTCLLPHTYALYLSALLIDRCSRIDRRCATKYGEPYAKYCEAVPYKMIPGVF